MYETFYELRPEWRRINKPIGVEYSEPYYTPKVPTGLGTNHVENQNEQKQWTNVRGYGNILIYKEGKQPLTATYKVSSWNI